MAGLVAMQLSQQSAVSVIDARKWQFACDVLLRHTENSSNAILSALIFTAIIFSSISRSSQ